MKDSDYLLHGDITGKIIGTFFDVHTELGGIGYSEVVYKRSMEIALAEAGLRCSTEVPMVVMFRGHNVGEYRADLIVEHVVIVEIKTGLKIHEHHQRQTYNYLKTANLKVGLILNFGVKAEFERCYRDPQ